MRFARMLASGFIALAAMAGCRSSHVEVTVQNQTGAPVRLLEVDYPNASFGADTLATGSDMHYRIQVQGDGPVKVQYTGSDNHVFQSQGPALAQGQQGKLEIVLTPSGKAEFHSAVK